MSVAVIQVMSEICRKLRQKLLRRWSLILFESEHPAGGSVKAQLIPSAFRLMQINISSYLQILIVNHNMRSLIVSLQHGSG